MYSMIVPCPTQPVLSLAVTCSQQDVTLQAKARSLAASLQLRQADSGGSQEQYQFLLVYTDKGLELQTLNPETGRYATALTTDYVSGSAHYRRLHGGGIQQPLARAAGLKPGWRPTIIDATAGLGIDGFILASLGCEVTLIERSPVMGALLNDGLQRAANHLTTCELVNKKLRLLIGNAREIITNLAERPATIYLDPMYPDRHTSALNKQEMRIIRLLVGDDGDAAELLTTALDIATNRVVVKRPKGAPELITGPSHSIKMKNSRFDVYLTGLNK